MPNKKVLVCGATGFLGRNIAEHLSKINDLEVYGTWFRTEPYDNPKIKFVEGDLTERNFANEVAKGKDVIIQMSATTSGAADIVARPYIHVTDNAVSNQLLLRAAYDNSVEQFIFPSCTVMYPPWNEAPVKETDFSGEVEKKYFGAAWMKVGLEKTCEFYSRLGRTKHTVFRHSNVYGPYDKFDLDKAHVFAATIRKVLDTKEGGEVLVWGTGEEERDLLYVSDIVSFVETAMDKQTTPFELVNVGYGSSVSVSELVQKIIDISGKDLKIKYDDSKPTIKTKLCLDSTKAKEVFGWEKQVSLEEGIRRTIKWYQENVD